MSTRIGPWLQWLALGAICALGLWLRLKNNDYGLPYVYNVDEGSHFTARAVAMFGGDANPGYFQNPSGLTYILYAALKLFIEDVPGKFGEDPSGIYDLTRSVTALIGVVGVVGVFIAARRIWDAWAGVAAAALICFAFLSVAYGRIAVTDVGTLFPVAVALLAAVRVYETGGRHWYFLGGAMAGLAVGFKYTAGLVLLPLIVAALVRARANKRELFDLLGAFAMAVLAFFITTPYLFFDFETAERQIRGQAETAGEFEKLGQEGDFGPLYYLDSLGWGFGIAATIAAVVGAVLEFRRDRIRALILVIFPVAAFVYLAFQSRYFGRWLLPAYPALALLGGYAIARAAALVPERRLILRGLAFAALLAVVLIQPVAADVRTAKLLGREDTRNVARKYLAEIYPRSTRAVIEPAVPGRWYRLATRGGNIHPSRKQFVRGFIKENRESRMDYGRTITPETIDEYRRLGFCVVVTMSVIRGRSEKDGLEPALAYYRRLERESKLLGVFSPYDKGAEPPEFHFDHSYNYYPTEFARPGPEVRIYRLRDCKQKKGPLGSYR
ncbi:MAG: glycosyltransferase family 39 protein [Thermoleophilaceae bacterium]|nr:glycosyltransferase family 39 protein [Thermoleophilaceae bacterium]